MGRVRWLMRQTERLICRIYVDREDGEGGIDSV